MRGYLLRPADKEWMAYFVVALILIPAFVYFMATDDGVMMILDMVAFLLISIRLKELT